ncbi:MAG TPA: class III poly(R)-hydroxyalkanoic acid synthase subunit PhaE [Gammaproteobacteria bacterium]|jgi:class III poly(R)-hydroxyalkanoic acid synthase PhaE subunit
MASSSNNGPNEWFSEWMKVQQNYWESWAQMAQKAATYGPGTGQSAGIPDWTQGLDQWWKAVGPIMSTGQSDPASDMMQRVMDMSRNFMRFAEQGYASSQQDDTQQFVSHWLEGMEDLFSGWIGQLSGDNRANIPDWLGLRKNMLDSWDHFANQLTSGFDFSALDMPGVLKSKEEFDRLLNTPALGQWREHQHHLQLIARLAIEYQEADLAYKLAFAKVGLHGLEELRKRLQKMSEAGESLENFRALYDLWVEVNEQVYGEFALTDEYQVIYGDLTNTLMALRKEINVLNEKIHKAMNIPTRSEVNTINMRLQEQRRETRRLRAELDALRKQLQPAKKGKSGSNKNKSKSVKANKAKKVPSKNDYDNLGEIKGIGPKMAEKLYALGIRTFAQIAEMKAEELKELDERLNANGKVIRENWSKQAEALLGIDK